MNIFIDANIYLDYYRMSKKTLTSLQALIVYLKENSRVKLLLPRQTENEFFRNKNNVINRSLLTIAPYGGKAVNLPKQLYQNKKIKKSINVINSELKKHHEGVRRDFLGKNSEINKVITSLFEVAIKVEDDDVIFNRAWKRVSRGNPPGKNQSIGDAIVWESILQNFSSKPLCIISGDSDWEDEANKNMVKSFLGIEWKRKSNKKIYLYKSVAEFLNSKKKVKIPKEVVIEERQASEAESNTRIPEALNSPYFSGISNNGFTLFNNEMLGNYKYTQTPFPTGQDMFLNSPGYLGIGDTAYRGSEYLIDSHMGGVGKISLGDHFCAEIMQRKCSKCGEPYECSSWYLDGGYCEKCRSIYS